MRRGRDCLYVPAPHRAPWWIASSERDGKNTPREAPTFLPQGEFTWAAAPIHGAGAGYEVEFMTLTGQTVAVTTVLPSQLRPVSKRDVTHVRELAAR